MQKIPTLFKRGDDGRVIPEANGPVARRILGDPAFGVATRKYDGTAIRIDERGAPWKRYTLKPGKTAPPTFSPTGELGPTGNQPGWVKVDLNASGEKHLREAMPVEGQLQAGTYELCGPRINGNPEALGQHELIRHGRSPFSEVPRSYDELRTYLAETPFEGFVWWHDGSPIAKLKTRDFGLPRCPR